MLGHLIAFGAFFFWYFVDNCYFDVLGQCFLVSSWTQGASSCVHRDRASVETLYTLLFHYQTLPGSHLRASWSEPDFLLHRPIAISLSCIDLGIFTRIFRYQSLTSASLWTVQSRILSTALARSFQDAFHTFAQPTGFIASYSLIDVSVFCSCLSYSKQREASRFCMSPHKGCDLVSMIPIQAIVRDLIGFVAEMQV